MQHREPGRSMTQAASQSDLSNGASHLSYRVKILYGMGEIANAIKVVTLGLYGLFFATTVLGLPGTWVGAVGFIAIVWDAVIDPYIGHVTDGVHVVSRRDSFMLIGALAMGLGFCAFFSPPRNLSLVMLTAWLLGASFLLRTATSMYCIPYYALGANLSQDYHERTSIAGIRGITSIVGTCATGALSFLIFFPDRVPGVDPKLESGGYASMGLAFGVAMTLVALIALWGTGPLRRRLASNVVLQPAPSRFFGSMRQALRNPSFRVLLGASALVVIGVAMSTSLSLYFLTHYVKVSGSAALSGTLLALYVGGVLGTVFWLRVCKKFDKHWLFVLAAVAAAAVNVGALTLFGEGHLFGTGDVRPLVVGSALSGFFSCILVFMPASMLADVADEGELITGKRGEGALFGIFSFGQQIAAGVAILLAGALLEWFVGLQPGDVQQSDATIHRIALAYTVIPAALYMAAAMVIFGYELTHSRVMSIQAELHERRVRAGTVVE